MPDFRAATTISNTVLAGKFHELIFETAETFVSQPGQYVSIKVAEQQVNSYSISSRLGENRLVLLIDTSPGGVGSKYFESLRVGDPVEFLGPLGKFSINLGDGAEKLLFLGTGSGVSPLRCMIETVLSEKRLQVPVVLYFGVRYKTDIFWDDYFLSLTQKYPNFRYKLSLSRPDETWHGAFGHITRDLVADIGDASGYGAYLCGNGGMIKQATEELVSLKCPPERIYTEKFF